MPSNRSQQNSTPISGNTERIMEIRRRRRLRKLRATVICVVLTAMVFAYFMGAFGAPLALLGDAVDSVKIALRPAAGFPVHLSQTGYAAGTPLAGGFAIMGSRELAMYSAQGNLLRRVPHGYARPCMTAGSNRVCMYSRGDTTLSVESRTRNLFTHTFGEQITLAEMSPNGSLAVFTKTTLEVFDPLFESIWAWKNSNEIPLAMAFASDNKRLAVATILSNAGGVGTTLHFFNVRSDTEQATATVWSGTPVLLRHFGGKLLAVFDTFTAVYNTKDGAELARYDYGARLLQSASVDEAGRVALLFGDVKYPGTTTAAALDAQLVQTGSVVVGSAATSVSLSHKLVHVLTSDSVLTYGLDGVQTATLRLETKPFAVLDARKSLLVTADAVRELDAQGNLQAAAQSGSTTQDGTTHSGSWAGDASGPVSEPASGDASVTTSDIVSEAVSEPGQAEPAASQSG